MVPATVLINAAAETINEAAGTFSIPVTLSAPVNPNTSTFASGFTEPFGPTFDAAGNLFVPNFGTNSVLKVTPAKVVSTLRHRVSRPRWPGLRHRRQPLRLQL